MIWAKGSINLLTIAPPQLTDRMLQGLEGLSSGAVVPVLLLGAPLGLHDSQEVPPVCAWLPTGSLYP